MTHKCFNKCETWAEDKSLTLLARDYKSPPLLIYKSDKELSLEDTVINDQGGKCISVSNVSATLRAECHGHPPIVFTSDDDSYIARKIMPLECGRLQGFPDDWCEGLANPNPTDEELDFWKDVFETHRKLVTHASRPKTEKQIRKWLSQDHHESAEYKMWGNGVALPCVERIMQGIYEYDSKQNI